MKPIVTAKNKDHLEELIKKQIELHGDDCDLNHIDVSKIISMRALFWFSNFNGNISKWDVSKVEDMAYMFASSHFNGDISKWNTASLTDMESMFSESIFNGDISQWNVSTVTSMKNTFVMSEFKGDLSDWKSLSLIDCSKTLLGLEENAPYWAKYEDKEGRRKAIESYHLSRKLSMELIASNNSKKKIKI